ncbi:MAG: hypothetical protein LBD30_06435 [Verrucomicrobiales bacterium]|nr:hypothetical protein [Verrucomicrobiales bacterium]
MLAMTNGALAAVNFSGEFAPSDSFVADPERAARAEICLNGAWQFQPVALPQGYKENDNQPPELTPPSADGWAATPLKVPSPWNVNSFANEKNLGGDFRAYPSYPREWDNVKMGWLRRTVSVPADWQGRRVILRFEAVAGDAQILVNGSVVGREFDIFYPFEIDVTDSVKFGADNEILVGIRKASLFDVRGGKFGRRNYQAGSFWGQHAAGIWQDVTLYAVSPVRVSDVFVQPIVCCDILKVAVTLRNDTPSAATLTLSGGVFAWSSSAAKKEAFAPKWKLAKQPSLTFTDSDAVTIPANGETVVMLEQKVEGKLKLWSPSAPNLYALILNVSGGDDTKIVDTKYTRFGWRQIKFDKGQLLLNGEPIVLKGDSWHFLGIPQMTRRYPWAWYTALKAANGNAVRLHAQPYPSFYLDVADEMGVLILDETALWASDGGPKLDDPRYWADTTRDVERLVLRDRNHPSVFGWSVCNEIQPIVKYVFHGPDTMLADLTKHYEQWNAACRRLDPTREWVSADGDEDGEGKLPTYVIHYGDEGTMERARASGKPWGVGETSGAYYMTPEQSAKFNGERSYESFLGRMEGIALESYATLLDQRKHGASFRSVFNLAWYGLQPLPLGLKDTAKPPTDADGVHFSQFIEGKHGVQPERLGPYCTTLNPGYDPSLPLYKTWPLFDAIKAAFAEPPLPFSIKEKTAKAKEFAKLPTVSGVVYVGGADVEKQLAALGVIFDQKWEDAQVLLVDGANPGDAKLVFEKIWKRGGIVVVWGVDKNNLENLNKLLPAPLTLTDRQSSSLLVKTPGAVTAGLKPSDMYFSELDPPVILSGGLDGPLVKRGKVLLEAANTDWLRWNKRAEYAKTGMVVRSEREAKPSGAALVSVSVGKGTLIVSALPVAPKSFKAQKLERRILENLGLPLAAPEDVGEPFLKNGKLARALALGRFTAEQGKEFVNPADGQSFRDHADANGRKWGVADAADGQLDLLKKPLEGANDDTVSYLSFWLLSPRPLDDLLIEPNVPKLDLKLTAGDAIELFLNGKSIFKKPAADAEATAAGMPIKQGWNHFLIRVTHAMGASKLSAELVCSKPEFLAELRSAVEKP